ncbi:YARHG domain-containing protein [Petralouisia muris]|uniref:YARHG domain-containing protein n=1 Tax=Petralouisia muris TaxID=3032872 RepID=A0AC61S1I2_9FIRM|nr:YARHG domain-containing protein [Petralouisia muris]TGY97774.1 YARHG domain-containing protein [Petralouisia muris]
MKNKNQGTLLTIALGIILAISAAIFVFLTVTAKPPKLSQEKMQKTAEAAKKAEKNNRPEEFADDEEEAYVKSIKAFQVTAGESSVTDTAKAQPEDTDSSDREEAENADGGYLCPYSSERLMTEADVQELKQGTYADLPQGKGIIRMVVNELYAKYGYQFGKEEIQAYFDQKEWYQEIPTRSTDMNDIIKKMTDTERANVEFLSPYIEEE